MASLLSWTRIRQRKRHDGCTRHNRDELLAVDAVGHGRLRDERAGVKMPDRLAGPCVDRGKESPVLAGEYQTARRRQHTRAVTQRTDVLVLPHFLSSRRVERAKVEPPLFALFRASNIAAAGFSRAIADFEVDAATFLRDDVEVAGIRVVRGRRPVGSA